MQGEDLRLAALSMTIWESNSRIATHDWPARPSPFSLGEPPTVSRRCPLRPEANGKTTLARTLARQFQGHFFDLEDPEDAAALESPKLVLGVLRGLVVLDEVQRAAHLFKIGLAAARI
jgi:hypothetical protein